MIGVDQIRQQLDEIDAELNVPEEEAIISRHSRALMLFDFCEALMAEVERLGVPQ